MQKQTWIVLLIFCAKSFLSCAAEMMDGADDGNNDPLRIAMQSKDWSFRLHARVLDAMRHPDSGMTTITNILLAPIELKKDLERDLIAQGRGTVTVERMSRSPKTGQVAKM